MKSPQFLPRAVLCLAAGSAIFLTGWPAFAATHDHDALPNLDRRLERLAAANAAAPAIRAASLPARDAAEATLRARLLELQLERHEITRSLKWVTARDGFLTGPDGRGRGAADFGAAGFAANDPHRVVKSFVREHSALFGHDDAALDAARVSRDYITAQNGMHTAIWQQQHQGIDVFEGVFIAHTTGQGELVNVASQFVPDPAQAAGNGDLIFAAAGLIAPAITAVDALAAASAHLDEEPLLAGEVTAVDEPIGPERRQKFRGGALKGEASVRLCWLPMDENELKLCWRVMLKTRQSLARYRVVVDAATGEVLVRHCMTTDLSNASYRVFTGDSPTPFSPGYSSPGNTNQPAQVARSLVTLSALNTTASPNGWIDDGVNETRGNNVDAHADANGDDQPDLPRPQGSPNRVFDFPLDLAQEPGTHRDASVVNLFYWCNWMHDKLWALGFTEGAGNFQNNNFGRGGVGGDAVLAQAQDGEGVNNANFSYTDDDGEVCYIQMYLWNDATPDRDGSLDTEIMLHEYTHGLSQRLVGAGTGLNKPQSKGMGEGWSDFYAIALLSQSGDNLGANIAAGGYVLFDYLYDGGGYPRFRENYYFGIRRYPYSTDMTKNPLTFKDIDYQQADPHDDVPMSQRRPFSGGGEVHDQGEVWCAMLWEARANLIQKYGYATGNQLILQIVTDGMKLSPPDPNFVQARDAILQADQVNNGGANRAALMAAFAKRGLGVYATSPASSTTSGVVESFDVPDSLSVTPFISSPINGPLGGPFPSTARTFTLSNNSAASLSWNVLLEPPLEASTLSGTLSAGATRTVVVTLDANAAAFFPVGSYTLDLAFSNQTSHISTKRTIKLVVEAEKNPLTQIFDIGDPYEFDLQFKQITFTPDGTDNYKLCRSSALSFPNPTASATTLNIPVNDSVKVNLAANQRVRLFGHDYSSVYVAEDGSLALTSPPDFDSLAYLGDHFEVPRVSGFLTSLTPVMGGRISYQQLSDRFVATWDKVWFGSSYVTNDSSGYTNSFQIEMFFDGVIRMTFLTVQWPEAVTGLSSGGEFADQSGADFSASKSCAIEDLMLSVPAVVDEGGRLHSGAGIVSIATPRAVPVVVTLSSSDTTELTVDPSVIIPIGSTSAKFDITLPDDTGRDGSQLVYVTAHALNYYDAVAKVRVDDDESATLTVSLPGLASEEGGNVTSRVWMSGPASGVVSVLLNSGDTNAITVPPVVFIPAGQTSVTFNATIINNRKIEGTHTASVTATVPNWTPGSDSIFILDDEDTNLNLRIPFFLLEGAGTITNGGNVFISGTLETNLTVSLWSSNFFDILPFGPVTIPAGQTNALFTFAVGDNANVDGVRIAQIAATAPGFSNAIGGAFLFDNDQPPTPSNPYPPDDSLDWPVNTHLSWDAAEGELIVNGDFETGDFTGWTVGGYGGGGWVLNDGAFDPDSPDGPRPALAGSFSAIAVQNGNGRHTLSQEIFVPEGATSGTLLRWRQEVRNHAGSFAANQRFAVELRDAANDALLSTLYTTTTNDLAFSTPTNRSANIASWRGQRVRIVFVEEDTLGEMNVHLDNISVVATSAAQTTYDVYFGNDTIPDATEYLGSTTNAHWDLLPLGGGLYYFWRIDSRRLGITNTGPIWNFRTAGSSLATVPLTYGSVWKYVATGVNLGTAWRSTRYDDTLWQSGTAPFGFGSSQTTTIGVASNDFTTFYFRRRLTVFDTNRLATVTASLKRDDGAVVYINGTEAFRDNMPTGAVTYLTQAASIVNGADETNSFVHAIDPSLFFEGTNIIAVELHQHDNGFPLFGPSPDLFFDLAFTFRTNTGNLAPLAVNWVQPADFTVVRTPTNLSLRVGVVDDNLIGTLVTFYADGDKIGEDFITPFQVFWTNPPVGLHTVLAVATDAGGLSLTSAPLHVLSAPAPGLSLLTLIPAGSVWRYRQNGEYPGRDWTTLGYREPRDRSWAGGPAQLGYGDGDEATVFDFPFDFGPRPVTAYFRHPFQGDANLSSLTLRVLRDDGVAVYLNNAEVFRNNLPAGTISSNTLALATINPPNENTWLTANLPPSVLVPGANIAAAEVHQSSANSPDLSFDLELTGFGNFLPAVALTSPSQNTALLSPPSVQLAAVASDAYGAVTNVQFLRNGSPLGSDTTPPYQFTWNNPPGGIHILTAIATDNLGATKTSSPITLTIVPIVTLSARSLATNLVELTWPLSAPGYQVETTPNLIEPTVWVPVNAPVTQANGQFRVLVNPDESERYFRLRAP